MPKDTLSAWIESIFAEFRYYRGWHRLTAVLSVVVALATLGALMLPGVTASLDDQNCVLTEHMHTDACYRYETVAICTYESLAAHTHTAACYDGDALICATSEKLILHAHDDTCEAFGCQLNETPAHSHADACYAPLETVLDAGHTHTDACFDTETGGLLCTEEERDPVIEYGEITLACTLPERSPHTHTAECFEYADPGIEVLICTEAVAEEHVHTDACYTSVRTETFICTIPEHMHTEACSPAESQTIGTPEVTEPQTETEPPADETEPPVTDTTVPDSETAPPPETEPPETEPPVTESPETEPPETEPPETGQPEIDPPAEQPPTADEIPADGAAPTEGETPAEDEPAAEENAPADSEAPTEGEIPPEEEPPADGTQPVEGEQPADEDLSAEEGAEQPPLTEEEQSAVNDVISIIDGLPPAEEITAEVARMKEAGDTDALAAYREKMRPAIQLALDEYDKLTDAQKVAVTNADLLPLYIVLLEDALAEDVVMENVTIETTVGDVLLNLQGVMPAGTTAEITPVTIADAYADILYTFDIHLVTADGTVYQPETPVVVTISGISAPTDADIAIWHYLDDINYEKVDCFWNGSDTVTFEAAHFSQYAVVDEQPLQSIAESGDPEAVQALIDSGFFTYWSDQMAAVGAKAMRMASGSLAAEEIQPVEQDNEPSDSQITNHGGEKNDGSVTVSKTIDGTDIENVFDITLRVDTTSEIAELQHDPDMAVVIVMDISNSMNEYFGDRSKYKEAILSAETFLDKFAASNKGYSRVGYVAFNTDAHMIFDISECTTENVAGLKDTLRTKTGKIINVGGYGSSHERFTNIEAGLKMGYDMLASTKNANKYIIFLSDGFPTTYMNRTTSALYDGYDPYCTSGTLGQDGVFGDMVWGGHSLYGTSYSDKAAIRARVQATTIKNAGVKIFSIGVDVNGQSIERYLYTCNNDPDMYNTWTYKTPVAGLDGYYWKLDANGNKEKNSNRVVDRGENVGVSVPFEIGGITDSAAYKDWLKDKIGSGYYYDSTDTAGLQAAYDQIFAEIKSLTESANALKWIASDPMPLATEGGEVLMEFLGFYNIEQTLQVYPSNSYLIGSATEGGENSISFDSEKNAISWNLKKSGYSKLENETTTSYSYAVRYRVRLKNELKDFVENQSYQTNGKTTLTYQHVVTVDGKETISGDKIVEFPIPEVKGYLGELTFKKVNEAGTPLQGATFSLTHDELSCCLCRGDGINYVEVMETEDKIFTSTSDTDGIVTFTRIPSGHTYTLIETQVPAGYYTDGSKYSVNVAYDKVTVTETSRDGKESPWDLTNDIPQLVNLTSPELPETGGGGTNLYIISGLAMMMIACALGYRQKRKQRKGARS